MTPPVDDARPASLDIHSHAAAPFLHPGPSSPCGSASFRLLSLSFTDCVSRPPRDLPACAFHPTPPALSPRFEAGVFPSDSPPPSGLAPSVHPSAYVVTLPGRLAIASAARRLLFVAARAEVSRLAAATPLLPSERRGAHQSAASAAPATTPAAAAPAAATATTAAADDTYARDVWVASAACLLAVGDYPPAWTLRRRLLVAARPRGVCGADDGAGGGGGDRPAGPAEVLRRQERAFVALVLSAWPGAAAAWAHLAGLAAAAPAEDVHGAGPDVGGDEDVRGCSHNDWAVCDRAARAKASNYYAWVHRGRLLVAAMAGGGGRGGRAVAAREVAYARAFVELHVGDSSGWHYLRRALVAAAAVGGKSVRREEVGGGGGDVPSDDLCASAAPPLPGGVTATARADPPVAGWVSAERDWLDALRRRAGGYECMAVHARFLASAPMR